MTAAPGARPELLPMVMLLALGVVWGLSFRVANIATNAGVPALGYVARQTLGAGAILLSVCVLRGTPPRLGWNCCRYHSFQRLLRHCLSQCGTATGDRRNAGRIAAITNNTTPLLTYGFALGMAIERFCWPHLIGLARGFAGALPLLLPKASLPTPEMAGWVAFDFSAPFQLRHRLKLRHRQHLQFATPSGR